MDEAENVKKAHERYDYDESFISDPVKTDDDLLRKSEVKRDPAEISTTVSSASSAAATSAAFADKKGYSEFIRFY